MPCLIGLFAIIQPPLPPSPHSEDKNSEDRGHNRELAVEDGAKENRRAAKRTFKPGGAFYRECGGKIEYRHDREVRDDNRERL
jgi:hypothetical protein